MRNLSITIKIVLLVLSLAAELTGFGPIARFREGETYPFIERSEAVWLLLGLYLIFFIIMPAIDLYALVSKDRGVLVEHTGR